MQMSSQYCATKRRRQYHHPLETRDSRRSPMYFRQQSDLRRHTRWKTFKGKSNRLLPQFPQPFLAPQTHRTPLGQHHGSARQQGTPLLSTTVLARTPTTDYNMNIQFRADWTGTQIDVPCNTTRSHTKHGNMSGI